jgi:SurA N-terminal domain
MNEHENNSETTSTGEVITPPVPEVAVTAADVEAATETLVEVKAEEVAEVTPAAEEKPETTETPATVAEVAPTTIEDVTGGEKVSPVKKVTAWIRRWKYSLIAVVLVLVAIVGLTYIMEQEGRIHTGLFDKVNAFADNYRAVVKVNNSKVTKHEFNVSVAQLTAAAAAQGADGTDPKVLDGIKKQALDMLVNTELLKQEAAARKIVVTDDDINKRLESLKKDVGGEDVLKQRMQQFGVDEKSLKHDISSELTIQALLDQVFKEKGVTVSDEEIKTFYDQAAAQGKKSDVPKLEAVHDQIQKQLLSGKQQQVVTAYIEELRKKATIEVLI